MREDVFQNRRRPSKHVIVPITKNTKAFSRQDRVTPLIALRIDMLAAIDLDNDFSIETNEVQNVVLKWYLPPKFETGQLAVAQESPHGGFGIGRVCRAWLRLRFATGR